MPALTTTTAGALKVGNKPSVSNLITLIGDEDAPITKDEIGRGRCAAPLHGWITDQIPAHNVNANVEISAPPEAPDSTKQKTENACQIFKTPAAVSWDQMATATYGNSTEEAHQKKLATIRHFKSIEAAVLGFKPSSTIGTIKADIVAGYTNRQANTTPGIMAGFPYYISRVGGATAFNAAGRFGNILAVDGDKDWTGTPAALTKGMIEDLAKIVYDNGATMKTVYVGASLKRRINELYPRQWANEQSIRSNVLDVDTAVGVIKFKLHRLLSDAYGLGDVMLGGDFEFAKLMILREDIKLLPEIETAKKWLLYSSLTLQVSNAAAFAMLVGVTV